jgi:hypothetical protein
MIANTQLQGADRWVLACNPETKSLGPLFDHLAIDRQTLKTINQPHLTRVIANLIENHLNPVVANVLLHHDNMDSEPLQSDKDSGTEEAQHA